MCPEVLSRRNCRVGFRAEHLLSGACAGGFSGRRPQSRSLTNCFAGGAIGRASWTARATRVRVFRKNFRLAALARTASYSASRGTRCEVIGAATACPTGRRSWCYGHPRARGDQWPRLSEGTVQIHRNTDANRVDVHRRACERCGRAAGHQQRSSHHYFLL